LGSQKRIIIKKKLKKGGRESGEGIRWASVEVETRVFTACEIKGPGAEGVGDSESLQFGGAGWLAGAEVDGRHQVGREAVAGAEEVLDLLVLQFVL